MQHFLPPRIVASRFLRALSLFLLIATGGAVASAQLSRDRLLEYRKPSGEIAKVETKEDWQKRRASILEAAQGVMGPLPAAGRDLALDVQVTEEVDCGSYVRRLLTYVSERGSRVSAHTKAGDFRGSAGSGSALPAPDRREDRPWRGGGIGREGESPVCC